jgi:hypothetical protein
MTATGRLGRYESAATVAGFALGGWPRGLPGVCERMGTTTHGPPWLSAFAWVMRARGVVGPRHQQRVDVRHDISLVEESRRSTT